MAGYEEKLLTLLVEKYRSSKKDRGTNVINRRTQLDPVKLYRKYRANNADIKQLMEVNRAINCCAKKGWLEFSQPSFSDEIEKIYLVDAKVTEIEAYLSKKYDYKTKSSKLQALQSLLTEYSGVHEVLDNECAKLQVLLAEHKLPVDYEQLPEIWKALAFVLDNKRLLYIREASMLIYGSSKYFEENTLNKVCSILRDYYSAPCGEGEMADEILERFQLFRAQPQLYIKGNVQLEFNGKLLDVSAVQDGIAINPKHLPDSVRVQAARLMTVENWTSYQRLQDIDCCYIYLGGYANRWQRDFLQNLYDENQGLTYLHFGDIDAGGFYIYEQLCRLTGIPFTMYKMSVSELQEKKYVACLQTLTENDKLRLQSLLHKEAFASVAAYMLAHNVKLEQEIISLDCTVYRQG